jgi:hypothetical protein
VTTATKPMPAHGTLSRAKYHHCKCLACRKADADYQRLRYRKQGYGTWQPLVDADPVRAHLAMLREHGVSYIQTAKLAGLYAPTVGRLIYTVAGRPPVKRVRPETAAAILSVRPTGDARLMSDAAGTIRRIQALGASGWPLRPLGQRLGLHPCTPGRLFAQRTVQTSTATLIAEGYERLKDLRPEDHGIAAGSARKTRNRAVALGWRDPSYWEDMGHIDDPGFDPEAAERPLAGRELAAVRREEIVHLAGYGFTPDEICARIGAEVSLSHIQGIVRELRTGRKRDRTTAAVAS